MPLHTNPPSGNRRHLTSANAGAFIQQSSVASSQADDDAGRVVLPSRPAPFHIAKERTRAIFPAHCSSLASRAASEPIKNLNLFLAGQLRRKARTATKSDGRPATRSFDCRHTPSPAAWRAVSYANPSQAHAAPAIHGASI